MNCVPSFDEHPEDLSGPMELGNAIFRLVLKNFFGQPENTPNDSWSRSDEEHTMDLACNTAYMEW